MMKEEEEEVGDEEDYNKLTLNFPTYCLVHNSFPAAVFPTSTTYSSLSP